jgi:hypothetical protein
MEVIVKQNLSVQKALEKEKQDVVALLKSTSLDITSNVSEQMAANAIKVGKKFLATVEEERKNLTRIIDAKKKEIMDFEKSFVLAENKKKEAELALLKAQEPVDEDEKVFFNEMIEKKEKSANKGLSTVIEFTVIDITQIPFEYLQVNESAIKDAIKKGVEIKGIEVSKSKKSTYR